MLVRDPRYRFVVLEVRVLELYDPLSSTILPNCVEAIIFSRAALADVNGSTSSTIGWMRCSVTKFSIALKSAGDPIVEPMMVSCFQNTLKKSIFFGGPAVAP